MAHTDKRIDAYIAKSADFAKPVLEHLRALVHKACPEITETVKWGMPHFEYKGIVCSMASFKQHCVFGFWKASIMDDPHGILEKVGKTSMGSLGSITSKKDLPADKIIISYIKAAVKLNEEGINIEKAKPTTSPKDLQIHEDFKKALAKNKEARKTYDVFSHTNKKDYVDWVNEAKTDATRDKRIATAIEWMAEGKIRNWKYVKAK
ncbi:YdeI/OmpD-associated family protein [Polluticoccus soli]|uniref:YdeI/OmpD-associated family protein n=1 Tax=Polluticoccus soli TaxID=3034150 RepID=UPI0023E2F6C4|nr:DUF1801 domain-containing protein [Flavipsychrobacter sp. JY13-12]